jgi:hypothetical protein
MRWVQPVQESALAEGDSQDNAITRIVKYVPSEVIAAYTMLFTLGITTLGTENSWAAMGLILLFLVITIVYIVMKSPAGSIRKAHLIVGPLAFLAWAYPISSALLGDLFKPLIAFALQAIVIGLSIFVVPKEG